jgi:hypothetical protein
MKGEKDDRALDDGKRESGLPGGGAGRRDEVGGSGVHPASAGTAPEDSVIRSPAAWGQGDRGAAGYEDSGSSELFFYEAELRAAGIEPKGEGPGEAAQKPETGAEKGEGGQS